MTLDPPPPDPIAPAATNWLVPALWVIMGLTILATIYDLIALQRGWWTISQWLQHASRASKAFRWIAAGILFLFGWHVLVGFPWAWSHIVKPFRRIFRFSSR